MIAIAPCGEGEDALLREERTAANTRKSNIQQDTRQETSSKSACWMLGCFGKVQDRTLGERDPYRADRSTPAARISEQEGKQKAGSD